MDKKIILDMLEQKIETLASSLLPDGAGLTDVKLKHALHTIQQESFSAGISYALTNLLTADEAAAEIDVSPRRMRAIIKTRHERLGIGMRFGSSWLIQRDELGQLMPGVAGYPKGKKRS